MVFCMFFSLVFCGCIFLQKYFLAFFQVVDFLDRRSSLAYQFVVVVVAVDVAVSFGSRYFNKSPLILRFRLFDLRCPPSVPCQKCFLQ